FFLFFSPVRKPTSFQTKQKMSSAWKRRKRSAPKSAIICAADPWKYIIWEFLDLLDFQVVRGVCPFLRSICDACPRQVLERRMSHIVIAQDLSRLLSWKSVG